MGEDWIIEQLASDSVISINLPEHIGLACVVFVMCLRPVIDVTQICVVEWLKRRRRSKIRRRQKRAAG